MKISGFKCRMSISFITTRHNCLVTKRHERRKRQGKSNVHVKIWPFQLRINFPNSNRQEARSLAYSMHLAQGIIRWESPATHEGKKQNKERGTQAVDVGEWGRSTQKGNRKIFHFLKNKLKKEEIWKSGPTSPAPIEAREDHLPKSSKVDAKPNLFKDSKSATTYFT